MLSGPISGLDTSYDQWCDSSSHLSEVVSAAMDGTDLDNVHLGLLPPSSFRPEDWDCSQVLDWIFFEAERRGMDLTDLRAEAFRTLSGLELCRLSREEFTRRDPKHGEELYESLRRLVQLPSTDFADLEDILLMDIDLMQDLDALDRQELPETFDNHILSEPLDPLAEDLTARGFRNITREETQGGPLPEIRSFVKQPTMLHMGSSDSGYESADSLSSRDFTSLCTSSTDNLPEVLKRYNNDDSNFCSASFPPFDSSYINCSLASIVQSQHCSSLLISPTSHALKCLSPLSVTSDSSSSMFSSCADSPSPADSPVQSVFVNCEPNNTHPIPLVGPRRPGRPRKQNGPIDNSRMTGSKKSQSSGSRKRPQGNRSTHLWEFMRTLLDDPQYNPTCIKWENEELGVFRIVPGRSQDIAALWGLRKNNHTMTFDKLSRSLRWCRTYGFLAAVPKDRGYPKKLCFRFGEKASEWDKTKSVAMLAKCHRNASAGGSV